MIARFSPVRTRSGGTPSRRYSILPYRQLVFTIPRNLRRPFLFDRSLYGELSRIAYSSTRDFLRREAAGTFRGFDHAVPAMVASPQSFGDLIVYIPHGHAICSL